MISRTTLEVNILILALRITIIKKLMPLQMNPSLRSFIYVPFYEVQTCIL